MVAPGAASSPAPVGCAGREPLAGQSVVIVQLHAADGAAAHTEQVAAAEAVVQARLAALGPP